MKTLKIIGLVLITFCLTANTYSQGNFNIHLGPAIPVSDFGSDDMDNDDAGAAAVGLNVGLQYIHPLSEKGWGVFGGIDLNYNALQKDVKDDIEEFYETMGITNADYKFYKYVNVPVTAGLHYIYQPDEKIGVFVNAGLSLNFLKMTEMEIEVAGETVTTDVDLASSVGFKVGGGILLNQRTTISIDYLGLGKHDLDGEVSGGGASESFDGVLKVDIVTVTVGVRL